MGNRSVETKHSTELGALAAFLGADQLPDQLSDSISQWFDPKGILPESTIEKINETLPSAVLNPKHRLKFEQAFNSARRMIPVINKDLIERGFTIPNYFDWQGDHNRNDNGCPADIVTPTHDSIGGFSTKSGGPNLLNLGNYELISDYQDGDDIFEKMSPNYWHQHWKMVKEDLLLVLKQKGYWGRKKDNKYTVRLDNSNKTIVLVHNFNQEHKMEIEHWLNHQEPKCYRKVTGYFYQSHKSKYKNSIINNNLMESTIEYCRNFLQSFDPRRLGAFDRKSYYFIEVGKKPEAYYIPSIDDIEVELVDIEVPESGTVFGTGPKLNTIFRIKGKESKASVEFRPRYHTGTFCGSALMIQGLKGKENIWQKLEIK